MGTLRGLFDDIKMLGQEANHDGEPEKFIRRAALAAHNREAAKALIEEGRQLIEELERRRCRPSGDDSVRSA